VVDDEASGVAQAVWTETRTVTVAGHNQEVDAVGDCSDDFALHPAPKMNKLSVLPSEPRCRGLQDLQGLLVRDLFETADRPVRPKAPTEQSGGCSFGDLAHIGGRDVEESDPRVGGKDLGGGTGGTVTTPRRRNSDAGSSSPRLRSTRRQSRVASEPT
jgi:hypothetical protein